MNKNLYLVKEHTGIFKAANNYDIYDPETGDIVFECREENMHWITKLLRFTDIKRMTPFDIVIQDTNGRQLIRITRGASVFVSKVKVFDANNNFIGGFNQKIFSIGGRFKVHDSKIHDICELKGKWTGWDFRFVDNQSRELAHVSKKWAGLGKEMFTSADNYMLEISDKIPADDVRRQLIMGAVMCIDMVLKE
ncbi:MAG: RNAase [Planctomycetes bacterium]|nr:RNAase [Planctomycetota bacterium]